MRNVPLLLLLVLALAACGEHEFHPPSREEQVAEAEAQYSPMLFDSIAWDVADARFAAGNDIFASRCRKCHGPEGRAGTDYAREQELDVPSLVRDDWPYGSDIEAVRHRIYVGHPQGMPTWGVAGLTPREIDAVAYYVLTGLRGER